MNRILCIIGLSIASVAHAAYPTSPGGVLPYNWQGQRYGYIWLANTDATTASLVTKDAWDEIVAGISEASNDGTLIISNGVLRPIESEANGATTISGSPGGTAGVVIADDTTSTGSLTAASVDAGAITAESVTATTVTVTNLAAEGEAVLVTRPHWPEEGVADDEGFNVLSVSATSNYGIAISASSPGVGVAAAFSGATGYGLWAIAPYTSLPGSAAIVSRITGEGQADLFRGTQGDTLKARLTKDGEWHTSGTTYAQRGINATTATLSGSLTYSGATASSIAGFNGSKVLASITDLPTATTIGGAYNYRAGGTDVAVADGGTNISTYTTGDMLYASASGVLSKLAAVSASSYLRSNGTSAAPVWSTLKLPNAATQYRIPYPTATNTYGESEGLTFDGTTLTVASTTGSSIYTELYSASSTGAYIRPRHSRGASIGTNTILQSGDDTGSILFQMANGSDWVNTAMVRSTVDATPGPASDSPGRLTFWTTPDGSGTITERMRIDNVGKITAADTYGVTVGGTNRDLYIDNTGVIGYVSSARELDGVINKTNERDVPSTITAELAEIKPQVYDRADGTKGEIGLIAEDVEKTALAKSIPGLVSYRQVEVAPTVRTNDDGTTEVLKRNFVTTDEPETVNYSKLLVPMLSMIQNQQKAIAALTARVDALESAGGVKTRP